MCKIVELNERFYNFTPRHREQSTGIGFRYYFRSPFSQNTGAARCLFSHDTLISLYFFAYTFFSFFFSKHLIKSPVRFACFSTFFAFLASAFRLKIFFSSVNFKICTEFSTFTYFPVEQNEHTLAHTHSETPWTGNSPWPTAIIHCSVKPLISTLKIAIEHLCHFPSNHPQITVFFSSFRAEQ